MLRARDRRAEEVVVATSGKDRETREAREARERSRIYRARQEFHDSLQRRRRRDNLWAGIVAGVVVLAAIGGQVAYFTAGPGTPAPEPSVSESPAPAPSDPASPDPADGATPDPAASSPAP
jgi:hypothetical protein